LFERGAALNPDDLERSMTGIRRESERMSLLVEDLLLLARLDEGRPLERTATALDGIVTEAVDAALAVEPDRRITTEIEPVLVLGDRDRLRQALDNLLANVRSHTPAGTPVHVRLAVSGDVAVVEVADAGPGMNPDDAARVFERFYRTDKSRARASGGVGLGLSIVGAIVEAHGGRARVTSTPGKGATFTVEIPLAPTKQPPQ
jgi:two-component system OmpR family sensor kinase